jgi:hypothetical protein
VLFALRAGEDLDDGRLGIVEPELLKDAAEEREGLHVVSTTT